MSAVAAAKVVVTLLTIVVNNEDFASFDPSQSNPAISMDGGVDYQIRLNYVVNEDVSGLVFKDTVTKKGIETEDTSEMMGSHIPREKAYVMSFSTVHTAEKGLMWRGSYKHSCTLKNDDKEVLFEWVWYMDVGR